ncbi:MAG: antibiotic biosynthesis monooxygenase [Peptococcaceae bacterium]|jgi:quinol monooxygenase YgiN|nr:antibiotic biosynthesis monooxygenase [Peptococcaceae bacterium]
MIVAITSFKTKPGKRDEFIELAQDCIKRTHAEIGNVMYVALLSPDDEDTIFYVEQWESLETALAHLQSPHYLAFSKKSVELRLGEPKVELFNSTKLTPEDFKKIYDQIPKN